jgi:hypothetical protein
MLKSSAIVEHMARLYVDGMSTNEIAHKIGRSPAYVWLRLTAAGVKMRSIGEGRAAAYKRAERYAMIAEAADRVQGRRITMADVAHLVNASPSPHNDVTETREDDGVPNVALWESELS